MPRTSKLLYRNRKEVLAHIERLSRSPYQELLADFMRAAPDVKAIREFAGKYPDRWAQAVHIISQLAGFEKGLVINQNNLLIIGKMSDSQLIAELAKVEKALQTALPLVGFQQGGNVVQGQATVVAATPVPGTP